MFYKEDWLPILLQSTYLVQIFLIGIYLYKSYQLDKYLEKHHRNLWINLGSPNLIRNNSIRNGNRIIRFVLSKEWQSIGDPTLNRIVVSVRNWFVIAGIQVLMMFLFVYWLII